MARCSHHRTSGQLALWEAIASDIYAGNFLWDICLSPFRNKKRCSGGKNELSDHWQMGWQKKPVRCGGECSALRWVMQHAAVAVAPRCADGVNNFDIHFHEIHLPLPAILVFVPTNSVSRFHQFRYSFPSIQIPVSTDVVVPFHESGFSLPAFQVFVSTNSSSCFHGCCRSFPRIRILAFTDSVVPFHEFKLPLLRILIFLSTNSTPHSHEFQHSLLPIQAFLLTNVGKQKRHPFVGMSFSIAFPLSGGAWRIRTAVDGFADR